MLCLADYFAVISTKIENDGRVRPQVSFRVPSDDLSENPFPEGIENFALPDGWNIQDVWLQPRGRQSGSRGFPVLGLGFGINFRNLGFGINFRNLGLIFKIWD